MARTSPSDISTLDAIVPGTILGQRYELQRRIGSGTYGEVWQAYDLLNGHLQVAVKLLRTELASAEVRQRFAQECSALELLMSHPHIVAIRARGVYRDQDYMVLELLEGPSLADWLGTFSEQHLPELSDVMDLFLQICTGVAAAHQIKNPGPITHRDLKPENVMLIPAPKQRPSGFTAKLLDFGIARLGNQRRTVAGQQLGTPLYMAPEQAVGDEQAVGPWSDVFALGVMLVEMLTLHPNGPEESSLRGALVRSGPRGLREFLRQQRPDVPAPLWSVLLQALATKPADRYCDADALLAAITAAVPSYCPSSSVPALTRGRELQRSPFRTLSSVGLAACVALSFVLQSDARSLWRRAWNQLHSEQLQPRPRLANGSLSVSHKDPPPADDRLRVSPLVKFNGGMFLMGSSLAEVDAAYRTCQQRLSENPSLCKYETYLRESPPRTVIVAPFALERTEVTNRQLAAWLNTQLRSLTFVPRPPRDDAAAKNAGAEIRYIKIGDEYLIDLYPLEGLIRGLMYQNGRFKPVPGREEMPAIMVSWFAARAYCQSIGRTLPTEAQWEFAARGGKALTYPWGASAPRCEDVVLARFDGLGCGQSSQLRPVGTSPMDTTLEGVVDLGGNVAEWVQDPFEKTYRACPEPCRDPVAPEPESGSSGATERVIRGGSWSFPAHTARCATRSKSAANLMSLSTGFRCATAIAVEGQSE